LKPVEDLIGLSPEEQVRKFLPLKQGLKHVSGAVITSSLKPVRKFLPLKQGLKLENFKTFFSSFLGSEVPSIKTRIETLRHRDRFLSYLGSEVPSIKTMIETVKEITCFRIASAVRKFLPLKQGLKHYTLYQSKPRFSRSEVPSIKTRIETFG